MANSENGSKREQFIMKDAKTSQFSIKSLMKDTTSKPDICQHLEQNFITAPALPILPSGVAANQLMFNMAMSSFHEKFLETLRQRGSLYAPRHPAYAGVLASSLPGFVAQHTSSLPRPRLELLQEYRNQPWLSHSSKRLHSSIHHPAFDYAHGLMSLNKPKRIRTAFSPNQLVQLEASFDNNPYVVGQERRDLALQLQLTETQVKVWFQNRRTKQKRGRPESEGVLDVNE